MKKLLKVIAWVIFVFFGFIILLVGGAYLYLDQPVPVGKSGPEAEALADKMLDAIDYQAWDSTRYVTWTFKGVHSYVWDKEQNRVEIKYDNIEVLLNTKTQEGQVSVNGKEQNANSPSNAEHINKAWSYFCNDSFWLNAPAKIKDPGTTRKIVNTDKFKNALLVTYESGGTTPGDSYLWILDENGLPTAYHMWVSIIPIGGIKAQWTGWTTTSTGAKIAQDHYIGMANIDITNLYTGMNAEDLDFNPFPTK